ncbi:DUF4232 domain-containing protein [Nocardioides currus]|uniref:DUF4232 domain-containing protein n=1 Tax=Nocardioides currus TaxID=2133958 RepID=A0A2R7Z1P3_9ACTN|nr:DUF4232 domain-containing protein [Nocardioides currus]PUA82547.1 DUF4232 domain-containing protein [Nocardioides currus]
MVTSMRAAVLALAGLVVAVAPTLAPVASATAGPTPSCSAADVGVDYRPRDAAMSHRYGVLRVENTSDRACSVHGYGGLSYVGGGDGTQVGAAADREPGRVPTVVLQPGERATSRVSETVAGVYPQRRCRPTHVDGFRVYLPGETRSLFVRHATTGCDNASVHLLSHRSLR